MIAPRRLLLAPVLLAPALLAAVLIACAPGAAFAQSCATKVADKDLVAPGKLQLSINPTLPPQQFVNEKGELEGLNVDLGRALGKQLCLPVEFVRMDFPAMIPALKSGRFDAVDTGMFWTAERSKIMYMVPYAQQAVGALTTDTSGIKATTMADLSGHTAAIEIATYQERKMKDLNAELEKAGKKPVTLRTFSTATDCTAALRAGQVEAMITIDESVKAISKQHGMKMLLIGFGGSDITFAFRDKALAQAAADAFTALRASGFYDNLFDKYGMTRIPDKTFAIKGPGPG